MRGVAHNSRVLNLRLRFERVGPVERSGFEEGQSDVEVTPESSPVHESIPGCRRGGGRLCDRRDQVVGSGHRGQRHRPHRRGRASTAEAAPTSASSSRCPASRSPTWSIPTPARIKKRLDQIAKNRAAGTGDRSRHSPRARGQVGRRHLGRHAQSLARLDHDLGLPGGQGRLRRKTVQPQRPRRPDRRRGRRGATIGSSSTARRAVPAATGPWPSRRSSRASSASCWSLGPCATSRAAASASNPSPTPPERARFRHLARPGTAAAVSRQPGPLQLALVLGLRQRRHRQPGRPSDGHRPLADPGRELERPRPARRFPRPS